MDQNPQTPSFEELPEDIRQMKSPMPDTSVSPIRPQHPDPLKPKVNPTVTRPTKPVPPVRATQSNPALETQSNQALTPYQKAEEAVETLSQKMEALAQEYAEGSINRDQFAAIYKRYSEQRQITELLLERNPESDAWQSVVQAGHTSFLRSHFAAHIESFGIYALHGGQQISLQGSVRLPMAQLSPILAKLHQMLQQGHKVGSAWRELKDGNWVLIVPGKYSASVVIYSKEPAVIQRKKAEDAHRDFERANERVLASGEIKPEMLVYPHRALLEAQTD
jgi:hypothetical protein